MEERIVKDPLWPMICRAQDDTNKTCHNETSFISCLKIFEEVEAFNRSDVYKISQFEINAAFNKALRNRKVWIDNRAFFDTNVTIDEPRVTFMRSFFNTGGPLEIEGLYKMKRGRFGKMEKQYQ